MVRHLGRCRSQGGVGRVAQDADTAVHSERTGGPATLSVAAKPAVGVLVIRVSRIMQRDQHVDIQQRRAHSSSRSSLTNATLGFLAPGFGSNSRTPFRFRGALLGSIAWRTSWEITCPMVVLR